MAGWVQVNSCSNSTSRDGYFVFTRHVDRLPTSVYQLRLWFYTLELSTSSRSRQPDLSSSSSCFCSHLNTQLSSGRIALIHRSTFVIA